jgi:hypothetical protein
LPSAKGKPCALAEWSETTLANWAAVVSSRAKLIVEDSRIGPSEAYGGKRPAT